MQLLTDSDERRKGMRWEVQTAARPSALEVWDKEAVQSNQDERRFVVRPLELLDLKSRSPFHALIILLEVRIRFRGIIEQAICGKYWREIDGCSIESSTARV